MHIDDRRVPLLVLGGGIAGMVAGLGLQVWVSAVAYPLNIGGRPYLSWPMFIPVTFELTILFAAFAAVFGMFVLNGLPHAVPPGVQRRAVRRAREPGQVLPGDRGDRSEVRPRGDARRFSRASGRERSMTSEA